MISAATAAAINAAIIAAGGLVLLIGGLGLRRDVGCWPFTLVTVGGGAMLLALAASALWGPVV